MEEKVDPNHHSGKRTGYDLVDGVYHIAPSYQIPFEEVAHQKEGISKMLEMVTKHAAADLAVLSKRDKKIWDDIYEDLGLDKSKNWVYIYRDGTIKESNDRK